MVNNFDVLDFEKFKEYLMAIHDLSAKYEAKALVDTSKLNIVMGEPHKVLVIIEFPSKDHIQQMLNTAEHKAVEHILFQQTEGWLVYVDGVMMAEPKMDGLFAEN